MEFDLSNVLFITTANTLDTVSRPLLDRMEIIEVSGYTTEEKYEIGKKYLVPKVMEEYSVKSNQIVVGESAIRTIIEKYTRNLELESLKKNIISNEKSYYRNYGRPKEKSYN